MPSLPKIKLAILRNVRIDKELVCLTTVHDLASFVLYTSAYSLLLYRAEELIPDFERIRVLLSHDGRLHWEPGGIFRTTCDIDITYFPFDTQRCPVLIGAYSYYSSKMNITNASDIILMHDFQQNGEWHIQSTSAKWNLTILDCCPGNGRH